MKLFNACLFRLVFIGGNVGVGFGLEPGDVIPPGLLNVVCSPEAFKDLCEHLLGLLEYTEDIFMSSSDCLSVRFTVSFLPMKYVG